MAAPIRRSRHSVGDRPSLIARLISEPQSFALLQAVALAERLVPDAVPVGEGFDPRREAVRLLGVLGQGFPASDVAAWTPGTEGERPGLVSAFLSLGGAAGPLPPPLAELAHDRARRGDPAIRDFLGLFNHRLLSLFVRVKRLHRPALQPGRPGDGPFAALVWALLGLRTPGLRTSLARRPRARLGGYQMALLDCVGLLNQRPVSLHALERLLAHTFDLPVRGTPFVGRWLRLDSDQQTVLGRMGRNIALGQGAMLGRRVWDQGAAVRLDVGPMPLSRLAALLPGSSGHGALRVLLGFALSGGADVEVRLHVPADQVPVSRLSATQPRRAARLGWTSWLSTRPRAEPGVVSLWLTDLPLS